MDSLNKDIEFTENKWVQQREKFNKHFIRSVEEIDERISNIYYMKTWKKETLKWYFKKLHKMNKKLY